MCRIFKGFIRFFFCEFFYISGSNVYLLVVPQGLFGLKKMVTQFLSLITQFLSLIIHHSNSIFSLTQNKTCLVSFLVLCNSKFEIMVRPIYCTGLDGQLPTRISSLSSSFSFFLSSLLCLYSPLRPKNFAPLLCPYPLFHSLNQPLLSPTFLKSKGTKK